MPSGYKKAPGSYVENGVNCTMGAPFGKSMHAKEGVTSRNGQNYPPFDKPQSMGNGSIPTKFYDTAMGGRSKGDGTVNASMTGTSGVNRTQKVGNRRFRNPGSNT